MARKYRYDGHRIGWSLEQCEERYLIAAYSDIKPRLGSNSWLETFEQSFFDWGAGVSTTHIALINREMKRLDEPLIEIAEAHVGDYPRNPDRAFKSTQRSSWRDQYLQLNAAQKAQWKVAERNEMASLAPPHRTFEEWESASVPRTLSLPKMSSEERARRQKALVNSTAVTVDAGTDMIDPRLVRKLKLAVKLQNEELTITIVESISADAALTLAEELDDASLQTLLLKKSLG
jgi:hypothetical protein